jgi:glycerol kinase
MPAEQARPLYLALDQGGHASRALVFDARGVAQARSLREVQVHHPQPDWVEQDPEELVVSLREATREVLRELGARAVQIVSAGLATQRSSIVCWDRATGQALSPVISWQDRRAHAWLARFAPHAEAIHATTGLMLSAHYGASKLRWCLDHLPAVAQAETEGRLAFGPLASFLIFRLTEERTLAADPANAARTLLWNIKTLDWDEGLLHLFDIPATALPSCVPTRHDFGHLAADGQRIPLVLVNGDQSAALFAYGAPRTNCAYLNLGTGAFVQRTSGNYPGHQPRLLTGIVLQDGDQKIYVLEGTVNGAGAALQWVEEDLGFEDLEQELPAWLAQNNAEPPLFLNGISGLGAPYWIADFKSRFSAEAEPWQMAVAVAESIVFLLQANLDLFQKLPTAMDGGSAENAGAVFPPSPLEQIIASGGLTWYEGLCQRISDLSGLPLYRPAEYEATARGTAWLLAGKPEVWPESELGMWFRPRANPALRARYERWRMAMESALVEHSRT